ncbi:MAG: COX15/CtaA family protein [Balneolaceae bacterium]|nr:COX15/CtaA family protein [Balneolaceae bacterium]
MKLNIYQKVAIATVFATLFLILVGGLVRATGAGMGCPDWPKCFGEFIPPTSVDELPENYKEVFVEQRIEKNQKIVRYLNSLGFTELASTIENDPNVRKEEEFNPVKTWIEYINRLVGAIIGILVLATFITSLRYWKSDKVIPITAFTALILTLFQAWLGSIVVSTNLLPGTITIHMVFAMIIVTVLLYGAFRATKDMFLIEIDEQVRKKIYWSGIVLLIFTTVQMVLGTQVREAVDAVKLATEIERSGWLDQAGAIFWIHRSFSWIILIAGVYLIGILRSNKIDGVLYKLGLANFALIITQIMVGVGLEYLSMAAPLQVIHLVGIALMICAQFLLILMVSNSGETKVSQAAG